MSTKQLDVIILAGGLRHSPLRSALNLHELCLPLSRNETLLSAWLKVISELKQCQKVVIAVSKQSDAVEIQQTIDNLRIAESHLPQTQVIVESGRWRGTAGVLRDVAQEYAKSEMLMAVEAACLPPENLQGIVDKCESETTGVIGITNDSDPAGVYAFHRSVMKHVPSVGFFDVKEQLLPQMYAKKIAAYAMHISNRIIRLRNRQTYLSAVSQYSQSCANSGANLNGTKQHLNGSYKLVDTCVIGATALIGKGAVLRQCIVLDGARIGENAIINECIVGADAKVPAGRIVSQVIVTRDYESSMISGENDRALKVKSRSRAIYK